MKRRPYLQNALRFFFWNFLMGGAAWADDNLNHWTKEIRPILWAWIKANLALWLALGLVALIIPLLTH